MVVATAMVTVYGLVSAIGGVIGYVKARSRASLIAGLGAGAVLLACADGIRRGALIASIGAVVVSLALGARFLGTWRRNARVMPDLVMVVLSLATLTAVTWCLVRR